jgi:hypothetical protein
MKTLNGAVALLLFTLTLTLPGVADAAARPIRTDNPGVICAIEEWSALGVDPYVLFNGNTDGLFDLKTFFNPGTVTTGDTVSVCAPSVSLSAIWTPSASGLTFPSATYDNNQAPNPASAPSNGTTSTLPFNEPTIPSLTATSAIEYEWVNNSAAVNNPPAADVMVIVWTLPVSNALPSGAFEVELDNWCGLSPYSPAGGSQVASATNSSFGWNGNLYAATCAGFSSATAPSATDLLLSPAGVLIGYVDATYVTHLTSTVPGWRATYATSSRLTLSQTTIPAHSTVIGYATIEAPVTAPAPTGTVNYYTNGTTLIGTATLNPEGVATFDATNVPAGTYVVTAEYAGDATHAPSTSAAQTLTVTTH